VIEKEVEESRSTDASNLKIERRNSRQDPTTVLGLRLLLDQPSDSDDLMRHESAVFWSKKERRKGENQSVSPLSLSLPSPFDFLWLNSHVQPRQDILHIVEPELLERVVDGCVCRRRTNDGKVEVSSIFSFRGRKEGRTKKKG